MAKSRALLCILFASPIFGLSACTTTQHAFTTPENTAYIEKATTYAFLTDDRFISSKPMYPKFPAGQTDTDIRNAIDQAMAAKGYQAGDKARADLVVGFTVDAREVEQQYVDAYYGRFRNVRTIQVLDQDYTEGSLAIDVFDARNGNLIWSGSEQHDFYSPPRNRLTGIVIKAVNEIMDDLPRKTKAGTG